jgi:Fic family protein
VAIISASQGFKEATKRIETDRFGPFVFQIGLAASEIDTAMIRVNDAHERLINSPLSQVANRLEREVLASSIFGTNSIEGGTLSESETSDVLTLDPREVEEEEKRRVVNIKAAYDIATKTVGEADWHLDVNFICQLHAAITAGLPHERNIPGQLRDNPKDVVTYVGDEAHGGRYKPPQYGRDIQRLLNELIAWLAELEKAKVPALIRAPLAHLYFELIHPFWDGNGRVGRVIEATVLMAAGYRYAPFSQARFYLDHIDRYFTLFNSCRKGAEKGVATPNTDFVTFHLEGMLASINRLHASVNRIVGLLLFEARVRSLLDAKKINARQYAIVHQVLSTAVPPSLEEFRSAPWYVALYTKRTGKTRQRDLRRLVEANLLHIDDKKRLWPGFLKPSNSLPPSSLPID